MEHFNDNKTYWNNGGKHQKDYDILMEALVPHEGKAKTREGEVLRAVTNITYDYYNNGNCNIAHKVNKPCHNEDCFEDEDECMWCGGDGTVLSNPRIASDHWANQLSAIRYTVPKVADDVDKVVKLIKDPEKHYNYAYDGEEQILYENLLNKCIEWVLTRYTIQPKVGKGVKVFRKSKD